MTTRRSGHTSREFLLLVWSACLILAGSLLGVLVVFDNETYLGGAVQSDSLLPALAVWDYSTHHGALGEFQLAAVPSIVPDLLVYAAVQLASGSWRLATLAFGGAALLAIVVLGGVIVRDITGCAWRTGAQCVLLLALLCVMLELPVTEASKHLLLFVPVQHGGSFILSLATLSLARSWLDRPRKRILLSVLGLCFAAVISDPLFLITAIAPLLAALVYLMARKRITSGMAGSMLAGLFVAVAAARFLDLALVREPVSGVAWLSVPERADRFLGSMWEIAAAAPLTVVLVDVLPLIALLAYPSMIRRSVRRGESQGAAEFWWVASASGVLATLLAIPLYYVDLASYRYASAVLWWPLIWAAAALARAAGSMRGYVSGAALSGVTVVLGFAFFRGGPHAPAVLDWRHPLEVCLSQSGGLAGLRAGLADYWNARAIEASSDWRLQVDQIKPDGSANYWGNNRSWYWHNIHDGSRPPEYNYIVMDGLDEAAIRARYGSPDQILDCAGASVWIYDDPAEVRQVLLSLSPILSIRR